MSEVFARTLIKNLNNRIESTELQGTDIRLSLIIYRNSIQETMTELGHKLD